MTLSLDSDVGVSVAADAVERAQRAGASASKVMHTCSERFEVNFDTGQLSLARSTVSDGMTITVYDGFRKGTAELTGRDHDGVDAAVAQALAAARASEPDPANVLPEAPAAPATSRGPEAADKTAMIDSVAAFLDRMRLDHPSLLSWSSHYSFVNQWSSYANSSGRIQHARRGVYRLNLVVAGRDERASTSFQSASLASEALAVDLADVPVVSQCLRDTEASFRARPVPATFVGDLILTPQALAGLLSSVVSALGGLALMKKTSPFLDRLGEEIAAAGFSLLHRPQELATAPPFDDEGFPNQPLDIIRAGVLENFLIDWYMSHKLGRPKTTGLTSLIVEPGGDSLDDIVAGCRRGILMGRYSGGVPNQALDFSGVAKNSFYVENGRIVGPVSETMVAGNLVRLLSDIEAVSVERLDYGSYRMPWVSAPGVTISTR